MTNSPKRNQGFNGLFMVVFVLCGLVATAVILFRNEWKLAQYATTGKKSIEASSKKLTGKSNGSVAPKKLKEPMGQGRNNRLAQREPLDDAQLVLEENFLNQWSADATILKKITPSAKNVSKQSSPLMPGKVKPIISFSEQTLSKKIRLRNAYRTRVFWSKYSFAKNTAGFGVALEQDLAQPLSGRPEVIWQAFKGELKVKDLSGKSSKLGQPPLKPPFAEGTLWGKEGIQSQILVIPATSLSTESPNIILVLKVGLNHPVQGRQESETAMVRLRSLGQNLARMPWEQIVINLGPELSHDGGGKEMHSRDWIAVWNTPSQIVKKSVFTKSEASQGSQVESLFSLLARHQDFLMTSSAGQPL